MKKLFLFTVGIFLFLGGQALFARGPDCSGMCYCPCVGARDFGSVFPCTDPAAARCGALGCTGVQRVDGSLPGDDPSAGEDAVQKAAFENLGCFKVLAPPNPNYNCIASTMDLDTTWLWGDVDRFYGDGDGTVSVEDFSCMYCAVGYADVGSNCSHQDGFEKVALFGKSGKPTHAAKELFLSPGGQWWTSKEGGYKKSLHPLSQIGGTAYGDVMGCYSRPVGRTAPCPDYCSRCAYSMSARALCP